MNYSHSQLCLRFCLWNTQFKKSSLILSFGLPIMCVCVCVSLFGWISVSHNKQPPFKLVFDLNITPFKKPPQVSPADHVRNFAMHLYRLCKFWFIKLNCTTCNLLFVSVYYYTDNPMRPGTIVFFFFFFFIIFKYPNPAEFLLK